MPPMRRLRSPWLLALPLMAAGSLAAHGVGYRLAVPEAHERARELQHTGHSYFDHLPLLGALIAAPALVALAFAAFGASSGRAGSLGPWPFGLLPPLCFVLQEHLERFVHSGAFPWQAGLERTFLVGVLLQAPFALMAFLLARALLVGIEAMRQVLTGHPPRRRERPRRHRFQRPQAWSWPLAVLAVGHAERGPPAPLRL
jgi:hypothetical protein